MANLFASGFETGNLTEWSSATIDGGDLSAAAGAKLHGTYGLSVLINDATLIFVRDDTPNGETRYRCRFYIDPNSITMVNNTAFNIFKGLAANGTGNSIVDLRYTTVGGYLIDAGIRLDSGSFTNTSNYAITDAPHCIELDWKASSAADANDGFLELIIDGISKQTLTGIDNDTRVMDFVELGAVGGLTTQSGTIFLDDFSSNNDGGGIGMITAALKGGRSLLGVGA